MLTRDNETMFETETDVETILEQYRRLRASLKRNQAGRSYFHEELQATLTKQAKQPDTPPQVWLSEGLPPGSEHSAGHGLNNFHSALVAFADGSCANNSPEAIVDINNKAGWAACVISKDSYKLEIFGPVIRDKHSPFFLGADHSSNNAAEVTALYEALRLLKHSTLDDSPLILCFDSEIAVQSSLGLLASSTNNQLIHNTNILIIAIACTNPIFFLHVKGHLGNYWNEIADFLAKRGARDEISPWSWTHCSVTEQLDKDFLLYGILKSEYTETNISRDIKGAPIPRTKIQNQENANTETKTK